MKTPISAAFTTITRNILTMAGSNPTHRNTDEKNQRSVHMLTGLIRRTAFALALLLALVLSPAPARADMPYQQLIPTANNLLNNFWQQTFAAWRRPYHPARGMHWYNQRMNSPCGGVFELQNAYYCSTSHSIYFDNNFLWSLYKEKGDYATVAVLAHEYGHLVQKNLGIIGGQRQYYSIKTELQADCLAGAFSNYAAQQGLLELGDDAEAINQFFSLGDRAGTPWFHSHAHGSPQLRVRNYLMGRRYGAAQCFAGRQW